MEEEPTFHINNLELMVILKALEALQVHIQGEVVRLLCDNPSTISYSRQI